MNITSWGIIVEADTTQTEIFSPKDNLITPEDRDNVTLWTPQNITFPNDQPNFVECDIRSDDEPYPSAWCNKLFNVSGQNPSYDYSGACCMQVKWHKVMWEDISPLMLQNRILIEEYGFPAVENYETKYVCAHKYMQTNYYPYLPGFYNMSKMNETEDFSEVIEMMNATLVMTCMGGMFRLASLAVVALAAAAVNA